jgi:hypothetical protein
MLLAQSRAENVEKFPALKLTRARFQYGIGLGVNHPIRKLLDLKSKLKHEVLKDPTGHCQSKASEELFERVSKNE